jgi:hypothetical protein
MRAQEILGKTVAVRSGPSASAPKLVLTVAPYMIVEYVAIVHDADPDKHDGMVYMWLDLGGGRYVNYIYPPNGLRFKVIPDVPVPPPTPPSADPLVRPTVVPAGKRVAFVLRNFEWAGVSRPTMNGNRNPFIHGLPDTCPFYGSAQPLLGRAQQEAWFELLKLAAPTFMDLKTLKKAWTSITADDKAFTNKAGSATRADWINMTNLAAGPMRFCTVTVGGAVHEIVGGPTNKNSEPCWEVRAANYIKLHFDPFTVFWATSSCRSGMNLWNRKWANEQIEEPFWNLDGHPVMVPMFSVTDTVFIPCNRVRVLNAGDTIPSPYYRKLK